MSRHRQSCANLEEAPNHARRTRIKQPHRASAPCDAAIAEITRRLIDVCQPLRIYLFGSVARGDDGPDSDLDFLVVVPDNATDDIFHPGKLVRALWGIPYGADVIPWRQTDFDGRAAFVLASLPATVLREGRLLYNAQPMAA